MRIKVGNTWYGSNDGPIMVELTEKDKQNISNMAENASRYCQYSENITHEQILAWMNSDESKNPIILERPENMPPCWVLYLGHVRYCPFSIRLRKDRPPATFPAKLGKASEDVVHTCGCTEHIFYGLMFECEADMEVECPFNKKND